LKMSSLRTKSLENGSTTEVPHTWVTSPRDLEELVDTLLQVDAYAIDTEFHRERTYYPHLALVQIGWPGGLALIDPLNLDIRPFARLFESNVEAVLHAADQDIEVLEHVVGLSPRRFFDTQLAAGFVGFSTPSLATLAERVLGIRLSKGDRLTDWTQRPLTTAQRNYAASDVLYLLELREKLSQQLLASGRTQWLTEELELLHARSRGEGHAERAWWRLKDGRVLRGKDRVIAQQLCVWRERKAQVEDKPVRFVLPDLAVLTIAQSRPDTTEKLGAVRGLDGRYLKNGASREILHVLETASQLPMSALHVPVPEDFDRKLRPALTLVSAWVAQLARDAKIDATLLATRADLVSLLRGDADARLGTSWRSDIVGAAVQDLVSGKAALAFGAAGSLVIEERSGKSLSIDLVTPDADWVLESPSAADDDEAS
jgi:ribonuclease D